MKPPTSTSSLHCEPFTRLYRGWMLFMLMLMNALNLADRQGMAAMMPVIKRDLQLTDTQLGLIQGLGFGAHFLLLTAAGFRANLATMCGLWSNEGRAGCEVDSQNGGPSSETGSEGCGGGDCVKR